MQPQWPHVFQACAERVTVPYQQLKEFAAPTGSLLAWSINLALDGNLCRGVSCPAVFSGAESARR